MNTQRTERSTCFSRAQGDASLSVHSIWYTIQGEGPFAGVPAVFIRLAGCNLQCPLCDTDYTSSRIKMNIQTIRKQVLDCLPLTRKVKVIGPDNELVQYPEEELPLVVITGGEPFRQKDILWLVHDLVQTGFTVQIETNGTLGPEDCTTPDDVAAIGSETYAELMESMDLAFIVCCPKVKNIRPEVYRHVYAWKYVVRAGQEFDTRGFPIGDTLGYPYSPASPDCEADPKKIYIQPCDEDHPDRMEANIKQAVELCLTYGYSLCLQMHKLVGLL